MVNFGPLTAEIDSVVLMFWGIPANFNGFRVLAALLHGTVVVGVSQALRRWTEGAMYIGRAAITLGIGPHSSIYSLFVLSCITDCFTVCCHIVNGLIKTLFVMAALRNSPCHYIFALWFLLLSIFFRMQVWNVLHAARWLYRTQNIAKNSPSGAPSHNFVGLHLRN